MAGKLGRNRKSWQIKNKALFDAIAPKYKLCDFAKLVNVSVRQVQRWIYDGAIPNDIQKVNSLLGKEVF